MLLTIRDNKVKKKKKKRKHILISRQLKLFFWDSSGIVVKSRSGALVELELGFFQGHYHEMKCNQPYSGFELVTITIALHASPCILTF